MACGAGEERRGAIKQIVGDLVDAEEVINRTVCKSIKHVMAFPRRLNEGHWSQNPPGLVPDIRILRILLKISTPMEFSNFSCEKLFFFFFLLKGFQFWALYVTNRLLLILNFHGLHLEAKQGTCSVHPICSLHLLLRVWSCWEPWKIPWHTQLPHQTPFPKKEQAGFTAG